MSCVELCVAPLLCESVVVLCTADATQNKTTQQFNPSSSQTIKQNKTNQNPSSIGRQFEAFSHGFRLLCDGPAIRLFNACEVERLVCGNPNLDFAALERNAKYDGGFSAQSQAAQWLWQIVKDDFTFEEKKLFLKFFTGSDR